MPEPTLMSMLQKRARSAAALDTLLSDVCRDLALDESESASPVCLGYALLRVGARPEEVARLLSWREFEGLSAALLKASGYSVRENVVLTKPRAQLDVVATGDSMILSVDCKHYGRENSPSSLTRFALDQLRRSELFRKKFDDRRPIASMILSMSQPEGSFVEGVAVVPIRTLRSFLATVESYIGLLELR
ncbi:MAG: restriction endonuclease [Nitrososphaerota archaeon]|nr:restriction endonuclease [Nitrososphaerota archaeon]